MKFNSRLDLNKENKKTVEENPKPNPVPPTTEAYNRAIRELTHANLRLHQLDKAKDEFISIASHELRNPMAIIKGTISMILAGDDGEINPEVKSDLRDVMVVVARQIRMVNELLDISRIEAGVIYFNLLSELDLVNLAHLLEASLNLVADQNSVKIVVVDSPNIPKIQGDQDKISQVLINLVSNALKFTNNGSITLSFKKAGDFVVTSVTDTGSGMPEEKKEELFKKFTKPADPTVATMSTGSGLGLYISKKFVEHLGGKLWLERSEPGKGSTFCFSMPITGSTSAKEVEDAISVLQNLKQVYFKTKGG